MSQPATSLDLALSCRYVETLDLGANAVDNPDDVIDASEELA